MRAKDWIREFFIVKRGLHTYTEISNQLMVEWIDESRESLSKVCIFSLDFADDEICRKVISLNGLSH